MLTHGDKIVLGGVRGDKFVFGAIRGDKEVLGKSILSEATSKYILSTYGEKAYAQALEYCHHHPDFIPFLEEDNDTIVSIGDFGYYRGVRTGNIQLDDVYPTKRTTYDFIGMTISKSNSGNDTPFFGIRQKNVSGVQPDDYIYGCNDYTECYIVRDKMLNPRGSNPKGGIPYRYEFTYDKFTFTKLDDGLTETYDTQIPDDFVILNEPLTINGMTNSISRPRHYIVNYFIIKENGVIIKHFIPFKDKVNGYYLLDLLTFEKKSVKITDVSEIKETIFAYETT